MKRIVLIISITIFSLSPLRTLSQSEWTLEGCIQYALENNLTLQSLAYASALGDEQHKQSFRAFLPSAVASTNYNIRYGRSIDPNTNDVSTVNFFSNNYSLDAGMDLFLGFQRINQIASTRFVSLALTEESQQEKYLLAFRVMQAYYDILYFEELVDISRLQADISARNCASVKREIELNMKAGADLYEAQSVLVSDQLALTQSLNSLKAARLRLSQEMNLQDQTQIQIEKRTTLPIEREDYRTILPDTLYQNALGFIPVIQAQRLRVLAAEKDLAGSRGALIPSVSFFAGYGTSFFETNKNELNKIIPFKTQVSENAFQYIGLSLDIPLIQGGRAYTQIQTSKIAVLQAQNVLEIQKQELKNIINQLVQDYEASIAEYAQTQQQEAARKLSFEIAQKQYEKGLIKVLDLYTAKNRYATAQNLNLQVKLRLQLQEKTLAFYQGLPQFDVKK